MRKKNSFNYSEIVEEQSLRIQIRIIDEVVGHGVFALEKIEAGKKICDYGGSTLTSLKEIRSRIKKGNDKILYVGLDSKGRSV